MFLGVPGLGQIIVILIIVALFTLMVKMIVKIIHSELSVLAKVIYIGCLFVFPLIGLILVYLLTKNIKIDAVPIGKNE